MEQIVSEVYIEYEEVEMVEERVGKVAHYFDRAKVAAIEITEGKLRIGDTVHILGRTSDFKQRITSMQKDHAPVITATAGDKIGIQIVEYARKNDNVYKVVDEETGLAI